jgi:hypothetical protein
MAESLPLAEIEARLMLLAPISRGAHLRGPSLHAERLAKLWQADDDVTLAEAFRLLAVEAVEGVLLRVVVSGDWAPPCSADRRHWNFPGLTELLPALREQAWQEMLAGRLVVEGIPGERGKRHRVLSPSELPRLTPDWQFSRLTRDDRDAYVEVRVQRLPPVAPAKPRLKRAEIEAALLEIVKAEPNLSGEALENALCEKGTTRARARNAIRRWAPQTVKPRGRPRKNNSPK